MAPWDDPVRLAQHAVRRALFDLTHVLERGIHTDEALAEEIASVADSDAVDDPAIKETLRAIARNHRIRALDGRARLAGVVEADGHLPDLI